MNGAGLARAIGNLAATRHEFEAALKTLLLKWTADSVFKSSDLSSLKTLAVAGHGDVLAWYVSELEAASVTKLAKKLDPHVRKSLLDGKAAAAAHVIGLINGTRLPEEQAVRPTRPKPTPMAFDLILQLSDEYARRAELKKHKPADIKAGIRTLNVDSLMLPTKASKLEMIEHIEAAISAGWPRSRGILHPSQS